MVEPKVNQCFEKRDGSQTVHSLIIQPSDMATSPEEVLFICLCLLANISNTLNSHTYPWLHVGWSDSERISASYSLQPVSNQFPDIFLLCQFGTRMGGHGSYKTR
jgi:hypothetical protein